MTEVIIPEQLNKIAEQEHILPATRETLISSYSSAQQAIAKVLSVSKDVTDGEDPDQREHARVYRLKIKASRTSVEATRKDLKAEALRYGKAVDGMANVIKFIAQQEEERLEQIEKHEELKEQARKNALAADRREQLTTLGAPESTLDLGSMPDADWELILEGARLSKQRKEEEERKAEEARVAQAKAEAEERERLRKEAEKAKAKLAAEREAQAKAQAEAAAKAKAEAAAKAKVQAERLQSVRAVDPKTNVTGIDFASMSSEHFQEFLSKTEKNRKDREKLKAAQAKAKELEKQRKAEAEEARKAVAERIAEEEAKAKAPDKEKLQRYFDDLAATPVPSLETPAVAELCDLFCERLIDLVQVHEKKLEGL